jgi:cytochrome c peroxidase
MKAKVVRLLPPLGVGIYCVLTLLTSGSRPASGTPVRPPDPDAELRALLHRHRFTGRIQSTLEGRLGRRVNGRLADLGRLLWFDNVGSLNDDNTCGGCHSPTNGFGDTQSIAIGVDNNGIVGPHRAGPRNQRRTPMVINTAFFPTLMWNSRFAALSGNPFDNRQGLSFPAPEGLTLSGQPHLLLAQAFIPPTERVEAAGFRFPGDPNDAGRDHDLIRGEVVRRLNETPEYRRRFGQLFPAVQQGASIQFDHVARAIAEFEFSLVFADAPIDRFARGFAFALTRDQKEGALLFFGRAGCIGCHAVAGPSNEMFSDFRQHVIGVPQIAPQVGNVPFDGPGANEDFGLEQVTGRAADRYLFRTSPLRNVALQPAFFHNGSFTRLDEAIRHHLDVFTSARGYRFPADLDPDLQAAPGPIEPVLARLDPRLSSPISLTEREVAQLVDFVGNGLLDDRARPRNLRRLIPAAVPSGRALPTFE